MNLRRALWCAVLGLALHGVGTGVACAHGQTIANAESSAPDPKHALAGARLVAALRAGGLVIYFRHTATDFSRRDDAMQGYADCANQRLLSERGRADAVHLGREIRALGLAVSEVLASPMCRTMEHARLAFERAVPTPALRETEAGDYPGLKRLLVEPVPKGNLRWIVGHGIPFRAVAGVPQLAEGEAVVARPDRTRWTVLARLTIDEWAALAGSANVVQQRAKGTPR